MKSISDAYREAIQGDERFLYHEVVILFPDGSEITADDSRLMQVSVIDSTSGNSTFDIGGANSRQLTVKIENVSGDLTEKDFSEAEISVKAGLQLSDHIEWLNEGKYIAEPGKDSGDMLTVQAFDLMTKFDQPYSLSSLEYPATLRQILLDCCSCCDIALAPDTASFDNDSYVVAERPEDDSVTFRDVVHWVAQIACKYARINEDNKLSLGWYDTELLEADVDQLLSSNSVVKITEILNGSIETDDVVITGIRVTEEGEDGDSFIYGESGYVLDISDNKLIQKGKAEEAATYLGTMLNGIRFRPLSITCAKDPAVEAGDVALVKDRKGNYYKTLITSLTYNAGGSMSVACSAEAPTRLSATRYSQSTKIYRELQKQLKTQKTEWMTAMEALEEAMKDAKGLYPVVQTLDDGSTVYYFCDQPTLEESKTVVQLNAAGWAMSTDGGSTWNGGMTVDGEMVAQLLYAKGINANYINTGALTIQDPSGNVTFYVDTVTGEVRIKADEFTLKGSEVLTDAVLDSTITDSYDEYYLSTSPTEMKDGTASKTAPVWEDGKYMWIRRVLVKKDGSTSATAWACLAGATGQSGTTIAIISTDGSYTQSEIDAFSASGYSRLWASAEDLPSMSVGDTVGLSVYNSDTNEQVVFYVKVSEVFQGGELLDNEGNALQDSSGSDIYDSYSYGGVLGSTIAVIQSGRSTNDIVDEYYLSTSSSATVGGSWAITQAEWSSGKYYWMRQKITWTDGTVSYTDPYYASALTRAYEKTQNLDDSLNQQDVFNRLTNNGQTQGIYLENGKLYINGTYIATGKITDLNGNNYWDLNTGEFKLTSVTNDSTVASKAYADSAAESAVDSQTQEEIFNKLTNSSETQGIYLNDGKLYLNATYMVTGTLADASKNTMFSLSTGKLTCRNGDFIAYSSDKNYYSRLTSGGLAFGTNNTSTNVLTKKCGISYQYNDDTSADALEIGSLNSNVLVDAKTFYVYGNNEALLDDGSGSIVCAPLEYSNHTLYAYKMNPHQIKAQNGASYSSVVIPLSVDSNGRITQYYTAKVLGGVIYPSGYAEV